MAEENKLFESQSDSNGIRYLDATCFHCKKIHLEIEPEDARYMTMINRHNFQNNCVIIRRLWNPFEIELWSDLDVIKHLIDQPVLPYTSLH